MERAGAADMIPQRDLNPSWLCDYVVNAARNRARLTQLSESAKRMSLGGGPERLVELVESIGAPLHAR
jgi:UDP-N-acetylglucosamine:LPS N-acetylglucosamine transferase